MKDKVLDELMKELNLREKLIVCIFKRTFMKVYNSSRVNTVNYLLR